MTDGDQLLAEIEDSSERFPPQMLLIREIFAFSFADAAKISKRFSSNDEMISMLHKLKSFVARCDLEEEQKTVLNRLVEEEIEVVSFSQTSRCSVISL